MLKLPPTMVTKSGSSPETSPVVGSAHVMISLSSVVYSFRKRASPSPSWHAELPSFSWIVPVLYSPVSSSHRSICSIGIGARLPLGHTWSMSLKYPEKMSSDCGWVTALLRAVTVSVTSNASVKPSAASAASLIGSIRSTPRPVTVRVPVNFSASSVPACCAAPPPPSSPPPQAASSGPMLRAPAAPSPPLTKERRVRPLRCISSNQSRSLMEQLLSPRRHTGGGTTWTVRGARPTGTAPTCRYRHEGPCIRSCAARVNSGLSKVRHRARTVGQPAQKGPPHARRDERGRSGLAARPFPDGRDRVAREEVDDDAVVLLRVVEDRRMARAGDDVLLGAADPLVDRFLPGSAGALVPGRHQVLVAAEHERGRGDLRQPSPQIHVAHGLAGGGEDLEVVRVAKDALCVVDGGVRLRRLEEGLRERLPGDQLGQRAAAGPVRVDVRDVDPVPEDEPARVPELRGCAVDDHRGRTLRVLAREDDRDHAAHRRAVDVGPLDLERVEEPGEVVRPDLHVVVLDGPVRLAVPAQVVVQDLEVAGERGRGEVEVEMPEPRSVDLGHRLALAGDPVPEPDAVHLRRALDRLRCDAAHGSEYLTMSDIAPIERGP